ncbi:MAG: PKD domain-containing protein [Flavobacteriales bacterium]|nr:PKD domain-containing protein [Flavobacteriales bacterium]
MKRILSAFFVCYSLSFVAQTLPPFFQSTSYRGAFAPTPTPRWTDGWCNFNPQNTAYPTATVQVVSNITTNTTWTSGNVYLLNDEVIYVKPPAVLTIEPGTIIRGTGKGTLCVERGAKIIAQGTESQPIVFTSNKPVGSRNYGDWGGVVICGAARHNSTAGPNAIVEGGIGDASTQTGVHGGTNDDDSSGVFSYVRIEFCGISLTPDPNSEINGLSLYSVGRKTKLDHVQVSYSGDDSFEWFGGAVDARYLVAFRGWDDDFDCDLGYRGRVQFAFSWRDPAIADQSGSNGFEVDNDANGSTRAPKTAPVFSNVTIVGPINTSNPVSINSLYRRALHFRRNSAASIFNSIFMGYPTGILMDGRRTVTNYCQDTSFYRHSIMAGMTTDWSLASSPVSDTLCMTNSAGVRTFFMNSNNQVDTLNTTASVNLVDPYNSTNPDARPNGSPANSGASFTHSLLNPLAVAPNASFVPSSTSICQGESVTFTANPQSFTSFSWAINGGTPSSSSSVSPTATFNSPGTYTVTLTVTNTLGSTSSTTIITVNPLPSTPVITQSGTTLSTGSYAGYQWYLNGNLISGATNQTYNADTVAGNYSVVVSNSFGCTATSSPYSYTTGLAAFTFSDNSICEGGSITYTATTSGADSYTWTFIGGTPSTSNQQTVTVTYNTPGTYATILTVVDGSNNATSNGVITIYENPSPVIEQDGNVLSTTLPYASYQWYLDGNAIAGETSSTITVSTNGQYSVEVTDFNGCSGVSSNFPYYASLEEVVDFNSLKLYPNPAENFTTLVFNASASGSMNIKLVEISGRIIKNYSDLEITNGFNIYTLDVQGVNTGLYLVVMDTDFGTKMFKLVIK